MVWRSGGAVTGGVHPQPWSRISRSPRLAALALLALVLPAGAAHAADYDAVAQFSSTQTDPARPGWRPPGRGWCASGPRRSGRSALRTVHAPTCFGCGGRGRHARCGRPPVLVAGLRGRGDHAAPHRRAKPGRLPPGRPELLHRAGRRALGVRLLGRLSPDRERVAAVPRAPDARRPGMAHARRGALEGGAFGPGAMRTAGGRSSPWTIKAPRPWGRSPRRTAASGSRRRTGSWSSTPPASSFPRRRASSSSGWPWATRPNRSMRRSRSTRATPRCTCAGPRWRAPGRTARPVLYHPYENSVPAMCP